MRKSLRVWLRELHDRMGLTSIFVTHDQAEAMEMADRVAVLRAGRIEQVDVPDTAVRRTGERFVHEFLGKSVRFDCCGGQAGRRGSRTAGNGARRRVPAGTRDRADPAA